MHIIQLPDWLIGVTSAEFDVPLVIIVSIAGIRIFMNQNILLELDIKPVNLLLVVYLHPM